MYKRILLPLDDSPLAEQTLLHASEAAKRLGAELLLLAQGAARRPTVEALALPEKTPMCMTRQPDPTRVQSHPLRRESGRMDRRRP